MISVVVVIDYPHFHFDSFYDDYDDDNDYNKILERRHALLHDRMHDHGWTNFDIGTNKTLEQHDLRLHLLRCC